MDTTNQDTAEDKKTQLPGLTAEGRLPDNYLPPSLKEEFESNYRKERLLNNKVASDQQCVLCKVVSGTAFGAFALFHAYRVKNLWRFYPMKEKVFNVFGIFFLVGIAAANFNAGYQIRMGQTMQLIEYRPSLMTRLTGGAAMINNNLQ